GVFAFLVGLGNSVVALAVAGTGRLSMNGLCDGLFVGAVAHNTGGATGGCPPPSPPSPLVGKGSWKANDFLDVSMIGPKAAALAAPILSMSLRVMLALSFLAFFRFLGMFSSPWV